MTTALIGLYIRFGFILHPRRISRPELQILPNAKKCPRHCCRGQTIFNRGFSLYSVVIRARRKPCNPVHNSLVAARSARGFAAPTHPFATRLYRWLGVLPLALLLTPIHANDLLISYNLALNHDPDFRIAEANLQAGLQAGPKGRAGLLPQVSLSLGTNATERGSANSEDSFTRDMATLSASMPLFNTAVWYQASAGNLQARAADATYRENRQELILKVAQHYLAVLQAQDALEAGQALKQNMRQQAEQVQLRYSAGLNTVNDLEEARYALDNAEVLYLVAEADLEAARLALASITNRPAIGLYQLDKSFSEWPYEGTPAELVVQALRNNHGLQALRWQRASALSLARSAGSRHLPTLSLNLNQTESETDQYDNLPPQFGSVLPSRSSDTTLSLSLQVPIYSGGGVHAGKREARAQYESLNQRLLLTERNLRRQILTLHARIRNSVATIGANAQALKSATSAESATRIRYQAGTRNILDLSTASRLTHEARRRYQDSLYNHILLRLQLEQATGDLNLEDLQTINSWLLPPGS